MMVHFEVVSAECESESVACAVTPPLSLAALRTVFPFQGVFHFRLKVPDGQSHVWEDLVSDDLLGSLVSSDTVAIRAIHLSLPGANVWATHQDIAPYWDEEHDGHGRRTFQTPVWFSKLGDVGSRLGELAGQTVRRSEVQSVGKSVATGTGHIGKSVAASTEHLQQKFEEMMSSDAAIKLSQSSVKMGKAVSRLWSSGMQAVKNLAGSDEPPDPTLPTPAAEMCLEFLGSQAATPLDATNPAHVSSVKRLWLSCFPDQPFQPVSPRWRTLGFLHDDLAQDVGKSGVLAVHSLAYFADTYQHKAMTMFEAQRPNTDQHYPVGVVAVNLTLMLTDVLGLRQHRFASSPRTFWPLFDRPDPQDMTPFFEIFALAFRIIEREWTSRGATRKEFGVIMESTKQAVFDLLNLGPASLDALMDKAVKAGVPR